MPNITDKELIDCCDNKGPGPYFLAIYKDSNHTFTADTLADAKRIAIEYGMRISKDKFVTVIEMMEDIEMIEDEDE